MADYTNSRTNSLPDPASPGFRDGDTISLQNGSRFSRQNGRWEPIAFQSGSAESPLTVRNSAQGVVFGPGGVVDSSAGASFGIKAVGSVTTQAPPASAHVLIYGGSHVGIEAALFLAQRGWSVILVEPTMHLGGEVTSGISYSDFRANITLRAACNKLTREFFKRTSDEAGQDLFTAGYIDGGSWNYPCQLYDLIFREMLKEYGVNVHLGWRMRQTSGVLKSNGQTINAVLEKASDPTITRTVRAQYYQGCNPEPDLGIACGVTYTEGREAAGANEPSNLAGVRDGNLLTFTGISPYKIAGSAGSGLLDGITDAALPAVGTADTQGMWPTVRTTRTDDPAQMAHNDFSKFYDPSTIILPQRFYAQAGGSVPTTFAQAMTIYPIRTAGYKPGVGASYSIKNFNNANDGINFFGGTPGRKDKTYAQRAADDQKIKIRMASFEHFLRTDPVVPVGIRTEAAKWGMLAGEPLDSDGLPPLVYHRAVARMDAASAVYVADYRDMAQTRQAPNPVAFGSYNADGHYARAWLNGGVITIEGLVAYTPAQPGRFGIDLGVMLPKPHIVSNYIESFAVGCTYLAWGSIRVAPTLMSLGEAGAAIIDWCLRTGRKPHECTAKDIWDSIGYSGTRDVGYIYSTATAGVIGVTTATTTYGDYITNGSWSWRSTPAGGVPGSNGFLWSASGQGTGKYAKAIPNVTEFGGAGIYEVFINCPTQHSADLDDVLAVPIEVVANGVTTSMTLDLRNGEYIHRKIGEFRFAGTGGGAEYVQIPNITATGRVPSIQVGMRRISA